MSGWQEYQSGLPCPPPGYLPDPGSEHRSSALQADSIPSEPPGKPNIVQHMELYLMLCASLDESHDWRRMDICICTAESLSCSSETTTALLISYTPIQNKKLEVWGKKKKERETHVLSLGWEDPLEQEMATHSSILAWKIPWTEEPGGQQSTGPQRIRQDWGHTHKFYVLIALEKTMTTDCTFAQSIALTHCYSNTHLVCDGICLYSCQKLHT